jgi:carbon storage regulator
MQRAFRSFFGTSLFLVPLDGGLYMLILTRREGDVIRINDDISIVVIKVKGGQVRIGVQAPVHVRVNREEVHQRMLGEDAEAMDDPKSKELNFNK